MGKKKKFNILPKTTGMAIAFLICGFAEVLFLLFVLALDVLPIKYISIIVLAILTIDFLMLLLVNAKNNKKTKAIAALVVIVFLLNILLVGDYYIYNTYDTLQKISKQKATWEYYEVIVAKKSTYNTADDIREKEINVVKMESKQLNEAKERLITKADVTYNEEEDMFTVAQNIYGGTEEPANDEIILLSHSQRQVVKENLKGFQANTKVIYKIKVRKRADDNTKKVDVTKDSFNVLISGVDIWESEKKSSGLSDVNMVMTVNPRTREILLTSIPRDSYIPLHSYGQKDKLTHTGIYGADETRQTIEDFLGIDINYSLKVNFTAVVDLINAVGGIDVYSDYEFKSAISHWEYKKGWNFLTGTSALYFARERKAFLEGDMQRNINQQKVLEATIKKVTKSKTILMKYTKILAAVENNVSTDLSDKDMKKLVKMQLKDMQKWEIEKVNITGSTGLAPCYSMGEMELSCVFPSEDSVSNAKKAIHDTMYPVKNSTTENKDKSKTEQ